MKKSFSIFKGAAFSKLGFLPMLMTFLFFAAMQVDMKAQSTTLPGPNQSPAARTLYSVPSGPFTTVEIAKERLLDAMKSLKTVLAQNPEDSAPYKAALLRFNYYSYILANLEAGKGVAESIVAGLEAINNTLNSGMTPEKAIVEKEAAISLLRP